jgi:hypothetical protein
VVVKPGEELEKGSIVLRDGRIVAVGKDVAVPEDARVHDMAGTTIYAGFIDAHVVFSKGSGERAAALEGGPPVDASEDLTAGAGTGFLGVTSVAVGGNAKSLMTPERRMAREYAPEAKALEALRAEGFTAANVAPDRGLIRGMSTLVSLISSDPHEAVARPETFSTCCSVPGGSRRRFRSGRLIRTRTRSWRIRRAADASTRAQPRTSCTSRIRRIVRSLRPTLRRCAQPAARKTMPVVFEASAMLMVDRATQLSRELGLQPILLATGQEWRRPELARAAAAPFIVPVEFPEVPKLPEDDDWLAVPFEQLRVWDHAPGNPALLRREGLEIALTTHGLGKKNRFRPNVRLAIARGLKEADAIAGHHRAGADLRVLISPHDEPGKLAHPTVVVRPLLTQRRVRAADRWPLNSGTDPR